jgi:hypothetical protein
MGGAGTGVRRRPRRAEPGALRRRGQHPRTDVVTGPAHTGGVSGVPRALR